MAAEARLASLESRVQPHFLFNTLNSIAGLIHEDPVAAERMTGQFASLLRSSLDQQTPLVTLDEELRTVQNYLEIERMRFGDRLRFTISSDRAAAEAAIQEVRAAIERNNVGEIKAATERLEKASHRLAEAIYRGASSSSGQAADGPQPGPSVGNDDVIDAEVVDADESRRN